MKLSIGERVKYKMNYNGIVDDYDAVVVDNIDLKYITKGEKK